MSLGFKKLQEEQEYLTDKVLISTSGILTLNEVPLTYVNGFKFSKNPKIWYKCNKYSQEMYLVLKGINLEKKLKTSGGRLAKPLRDKRTRNLREDFVKTEEERRKKRIKEEQREKRREEEEEKRREEEEKKEEEELMYRKECLHISFHFNDTVIADFLKELKIEDYQNNFISIPFDNRDCYVSFDQIVQNIMNQYIKNERFPQYIENERFLSKEDIYRIQGVYIKKLESNDNNCRRFLIIRGNGKLENAIKELKEKTNIFIEKNFISDESIFLKKISSQTNLFF
jgi:hypothetical protein